jgi:predicted GH43/DUF377 family glycosyl hydrolase
MTTSAALFERHALNPILTADMWPVPVNTVFNAAACRHDGETILLCRIEDRRGLSHLWVARSGDGRESWKVDEKPLLSPHPTYEGQLWGFEDPRVVWLDELKVWAITCTAYGPLGPSVYLATTKDFQSITSEGGSIMPPDDKNAALLPHRIDGDWLLFHRPNVAYAGGHGNIWISRSSDLATWRNPEIAMRTRPGAWWDSLRIGIGPPPIEVAEGWLLIYHGVRETVSGATYRLGLALLDRNDPSKILRRADEWVLGPEEPYERIGDVSNVVFSCGAVVDEAADTIDLYYGAADTCMALATASLSEVRGYLMECPIPDE